MFIYFLWTKYFLNCFEITFAVLKLFTVRVCERDPILLLDGNTFSVVLPATPTSAPRVTLIEEDTFGSASSRGLSAGAIVAIVLALVVVVALVAFGLVKHFVRKTVTPEFH